MKASEVRIGNLVYYNPMQEIRMVTGTGKHAIWIGDTERGIPFHEEKYEPVSLTEEWLLRFGFKKQKPASWFPAAFAIKCGNAFLHLYHQSETQDPNEFHTAQPKTWYSFQSNTHGIKLNYVHQLQNLYYALTGKELKIEQ